MRDYKRTRKISTEAMKVYQHLLESGPIECGTHPEVSGFDNVGYDARMENPLFSNELIAFIEQNGTTLIETFKEIEIKKEKDGFVYFRLKRQHVGKNT